MARTTFKNKHVKHMPQKYRASKAKDFEQQQKDSIRKINIPNIPGTNTPDVRNELYRAFTSLYSHFCQFVFPDYINAYEDKYLYAGRRQAMLDKLGRTYKSNIKFPLVDSIHETYCSNTYDIDPTIKIIPQSTDDIDVTARMRSYAERAYHQSNASYIMPDIDRTAVLIGVGYGRTGFLNYDEKRTILKADMEVTKTTKILKPNLDYVDEFGVFFNPGSTDFYTTPKFIRDIASIHDVIKKYASFIDDNEDLWYDVIHKPQPFSSKDFKKIKLLSTWDYYRKNHQYFTSLQGTDLANLKSNIDTSFLDQNIYSVDYKKNDLIEVIEYYEDDRFCLLLNGHLVFDGPNPYPFAGDPIIRTVFRQKAGTLFPQGIRGTLKNYQHNVDIFLNNWIDTINGMANPSYLADKNVLGTTTPNFLTQTPGKVYEKQQGKSIDILRLVDPASLNSLYQGLQWFVSQAYEAIGLNSYTQGGSGKVERTAGGVQSRVQVLKTALVPFFKQKNLALTEMMKRFIAMGAVQLTEGFKIFDEEGAFTQISLSDLENSALFLYESKTLSSLQKLEDRQDLITALQYIKSPDTILVLEKRLLDTFDMKPLNMDTKKLGIKEQFELDKYRMELQQQLQPQQQAGQPTMPQQPNIDMQGAMLQPNMPQQQIPDQMPEDVSNNLERPELYL